MLSGTDSEVRKEWSKEFRANISIFAYINRVKSSEFKRWLAELGATFKSGDWSHLRVTLNGKRSVLPMHSKNLKTGTVNGIK
jgi:mRNA interferase HicA